MDVYIFREFEGTPSTGVPRPQLFNEENLSTECELFRYEQSLRIEFQLKVARSGRFLSLDQVQLDMIILKAESDQNIDLIQTAFDQKRNSLLIEQWFLSFERGAEPDFESEIERKFLEFGQVIRAKKTEIETINDNSVGPKVAVNDHGFEAFQDLIRLRSFLLEIHDHPIPDDLVMDIHCGFQLAFFCDFLEDILIPLDDIIHPAGIGDVDDRLLLKQLIGGDMDQAGSFSDPFSRGDNSYIPLSQTAMH